MTNPGDTVDHLVQRLRSLVKDSPYLKDAAALYEIMLPILRDADLRVSPVSVTQTEARAKMEKGVPLLHDLDLELDGRAVQELILHLANSIETIRRERHQEADASVRKIRIALEKDELDIVALLPHIVEGDRTPLASAAQDLDLDAGVLWMLVQNAIKPALQEWYRQLTPVVRGIPWSEGYCFICGAVAMLGELQGNNQGKHLRCGQCGADWAFQRLRCTYCGNEDHGTLGYLYAENQHEKMRVEVCDRCKGHFKVIAAFSSTPPEMLPVEDLATVHLDYIAQERGYVRVIHRREDVS